MPKRGESETALVRACLQLLTAHGWLAWRSNAGMQIIPASGGQTRRVIRVGVKGMPDVLAVKGYEYESKTGVRWPGVQVLGLECKRPGRVPTPAQNEMHRRLRKQNVRVLTIYDIAALAKEIA